MSFGVVGAFWSAIGDFFLGTRRDVLVDLEHFQFVIRLLSHFTLLSVGLAGCFRPRDTRVPAAISPSLPQRTPRVESTRPPSR